MEGGKRGLVIYGGRCRYSKEGAPGRCGGVAGEDKRGHK